MPGKLHDLEFSGELETHLTVHLEEPDQMEALRQWGAEHGLKCTHILLDRGRHPSQPMLTRRARGDLASELASASRLVSVLGRRGLAVRRVKIEAAPWNRDVPQTCAEAARQPLERYFEQHVKLLLQPDADYGALGDLAGRHAAHLSRNALRQRPDGQEERFVTQRCRGVGRLKARQRLEALVHELSSLGHAVLDVEEEYVVYDSNEAIDAGWIVPEEA